MSNAPKNLLQMVQCAQAELGLPVATSVIGNTDVTTTQMLYLINQCAEDLRDTPDQGWVALQTEFDLAVAVPVVTTGDITNNSPIIVNIPSTSGLTANAWVVVANGIPVAARILSVDSPTQITMTMNATATVSAETLTFAKDTYPFASDFEWQVNRTWWDRTNRWALIGPTSPQEDQWHRSGIVTTGPRRYFRVLGHAPQGTYRVWPPPTEITEPLQFALEYISTDFVNVQNLNLTTAASFQNDTDTPFLSDRALIMGLKWRFWQIKGYNYVPMQNEYVDYVDRLISRDGAAPDLPLSQRASSIYLTPWNVQDGYFPGPNQN